MSRVYLCLGQYANTPYCFDVARARVFCVEELCFFLKENAWMVDETFFNRQLAEWIEKECGLPELGQKLRSALKGKEKPAQILSQIFCYTGYFSPQEIEKVMRMVSAGSNVSMTEKKKAKADYFLESRRYALAIGSYQELLEEEAMVPSLRGRIWHNMGTAQARLFLYEKAACSFEEAYRCCGEPSCLQAFLAAKRLSMNEGDYLNFLTENKEYYQASLELEKAMAKRRSGWTDSRNDSAVSSIRSAFFSGEEEACGRLFGAELERLKDAYRDYVTQ